MLNKEPKIVTFGCRLNISESEMIREFMKESEAENTIVFNTCGVTMEAERQARQAIRKARRENPEAKIIVTGCAVQMNPKRYEGMSEIDLILGNHEKLQPESYSLSSGLHVANIMDVKETASHLIEGFESHARAFVQVQNGCNHRCTFCRIPFGRGNSRSMPAGEVITQIQKLVQHGHQEVVLTGVDMTDYGLDLPGTPPLGSLVGRILRLVPDLKRLRLSSLDPVEIDSELMDYLCTEPRIMPYAHLSLQAGDDLILKRMKRRHLRKDVIKVCDDILKRRPDVVFGADVIAGFPTETEAMFLNTYNLIKKIGFVFLHVFPYSAHEDTPASRMPQVSDPLIKERAARLRALGQEQKRMFFQKQVGTTQKVLFESTLKGHGENFSPVTLVLNGKEAEEIVPGSVVTLMITHYDEQTLYGEKAQ